MQTNYQGARGITEYGAFELFGNIIKSAIDDFAAVHRFIDVVEAKITLTVEAHKSDYKLKEIVSRYYTAKHFLFGRNPLAQPHGAGLVSTDALRKEALRLADLATSPLIRQPRPHRGMTRDMLKQSKEGAVECLETSLTD